MQAVCHTDRLRKLHKRSSAEATSSPLPILRRAYVKDTRLRDSVAAQLISLVHRVEDSARTYLIGVLLVLTLDLLKPGRPLAPRHGGVHF